MITVTLIVLLPLWAIGSIIFSIYCAPIFFERDFTRLFTARRYNICVLIIVFFVLFSSLWFVFLPFKMINHLINHLQKPRRARRAAQLVQQHIEREILEAVERERLKNAPKAYRFIASYMEGWMDFYKKEESENG